MYVIYSEEETRLNEDLGPAFWNVEGGWTNFDDATLFIENPKYYCVGQVLPYEAAISIVKLFEITEGQR